MSLKKIELFLTSKLSSLEVKGIRKGKEKIITAVKVLEAGASPRYTLEGYGDRFFLRMNSNSYLGLALNAEVIKAETLSAESFGTGPGAVRFISGTYQPHVALEEKLASFHNRESSMIMSAAYAAVMGVLPQFISENTVVISDSLNHNSIINAIRLSRPAKKTVYPHMDMDELENLLVSHKGHAQRAVVVTDGVFSMRGDHAPLDQIVSVCTRHEGDYAEGIITVVDDSHGVGVFGKTGRGTEEYTQAQADILIGTLGKAFGVNGGYVASTETVIHYLRETVPNYIYSNPITPAEAGAAMAALHILNSSKGLELLAHLRHLGARLRAGLKDLGFETLSGEHPIVPIFIRDTRKTTALVQYFFDKNILVTGLNYPVVPAGEEEIRLQVSADHTEKDISYVLDVLREFRGKQ